MQSDDYARLCGAANPGCSRLSGGFRSLADSLKSRLESRLRAGLPAPLWLAKRSGISDALH